jgi:hypothetical protein
LVARPCPELEKERAKLQKQVSADDIDAAIGDEVDLFCRNHARSQLDDAVRRSASCDVSFSTAEGLLIQFTAPDLFPALPIARCEPGGPPARGEIARSPSTDHSQPTAARLRLPPPAAARLGLESRVGSGGALAAGQGAARRAGSEGGSKPGEPTIFVTTVPHGFVPGLEVEVIGVAELAGERYTVAAVRSATAFDLLARSPHGPVPLVVSECASVGPSASEGASCSGAGASFGGGGGGGSGGGGGGNGSGCGAAVRIVLTYQAVIAPPREDFERSFVSPSATSSVETTPSSGHEEARRPTSALSGSFSTPASPSPTSPLPSSPPPAGGDDGGGQPTTAAAIEELQYKLMFLAAVETAHAGLSHCPAVAQLAPSRPLPAVNQFGVFTRNPYAHVVAGGGRHGGGGGGPPPPRHRVACTFAKLLQLVQAEDVFTVARTLTPTEAAVEQLSFLAADSEAAVAARLQPVYVPSNALYKVPELYRKCTKAIRTTAAAAVFAAAAEARRGRGGGTLRKALGEAKSRRVEERREEREQALAGATLCSGRWRLAKYCESGSFGHFFQAVDGLLAVPIRAVRSDGRGGTVVETAQAHGLSNHQTVYLTGVQGCHVPATSTAPHRCATDGYVIAHLAHPPLSSLQATAVKSPKEAGPRMKANKQTSKKRPAFALCIF